MTTRRRQRPETISNLGRSPSRQTPRGPVGTGKRPEPPAEKSALTRWLHGALFDNVGLKFLSMVLAITVFLLVNTDRDREISARVRVAYDVPSDKVLVSQRIEDVRITIKGPWQRLRRFDERELDRIDLAMPHAQSGDITITPEMIRLPAGLKITSISPRTLHVAFDRRIEKIVEITPQLAGRPLHGYYVSEAKPSPATMKVRGAEGTLAALSALRTRELSVDGRAESFTAETELVTPDGIEPIGDSKLLVHVAIDEELVTRKLPGLVVGVTGEGAGPAIDPSKWQVSPAQVEVTLTGALLAVEKAKAALVPVVKLSGNDTRAREVAVSIEGLPPGIGVRISPERVKISPAKASAPAPSPPP